jgi:predicted DNA-binding transcriptional regulator AlpA
MLDLQKLPPSALLTREQVAEITGFSMTTLKRWASLGKGPRITRVERLPRFKVSDVLDWMASDPQDDQPDPAPKLPIDTGVRGPGGKDVRCYRAYQYPFEDMNVGDSFLDKENPSAARSACYAANDRYPKRRFSTRTVEGGVRVWRIK